MNKIAYTVSHGDYSDYSIDEVFETEELANRYINLFKNRYDDYRMEEWEILSELPEKLSVSERQMKNGFKAFCVIFNKNGDLFKRSYATYEKNPREIPAGDLQSITPEVVSLIPGKYIIENEKQILDDPDYNWYGMIIKTWAKNEEHAIKSASDARRQYLALHGFKNETI